MVLTPKHQDFDGLVAVTVLLDASLRTIGVEHLDDNQNILRYIIDTLDTSSIIPEHYFTVQQTPAAE